MKALLDTHAILWCLADDPRLGAGIRGLAAGATRDDLGVSDVSLLEIAMLVAKGRVHHPAGTRALLGMIQQRFTVLPIDAAIAAEALELPLPQADPFDRTIVATARSHRIPLATRDRAIVASGAVPVVWE